jgi:ActR/RegA family two-component response regulator
MENEAKKIRGRVLFADDDEQFRIGLGRRLDRAGFECDYAASAAESIEKLQNSTFDLLLSDIDMPGNVALEMIEKVPAATNGLPVVLLTGRPTVETAARSVGLRVVAYLLKPPDFDELCSVLNSAIADFQNIRWLRDHRRRLQDWDKEVERLLRLLEQGAAQDRRSAQQSQVRLTLRNLVIGLVELENLLANEGKTSGFDEALEKQDLLKTIRKTIGVLAETRNHFKSKALAELRKELESLLAGRSA